MPPIEEQSLEQYAVLWTLAGHDNYGTQRVNSPVEIKCRWETGRKESLTNEATPIALDATVFVDREIAAGSIVRLGKKRDLPNTLTNLHEVVSYDEIPDIKARETQRTVMLKKYHDRLPAVVT